MENQNENDKEYSPDLYYKQLFSHKILIKELLYLIFEEKLYTFGFDFNTLKLEKNEFVTEFDNVLIERKSDCIWSIKLNRKKVYIFFHLEFQRTVDKTIAQRTRIYRELTEISIIKSKTFSKVKGKVPPIISIVLYNGNKNYNAPISKKGVVYFDETTKKIFDILNLEYPISENNKNTYYLIDETKWKSKKNKIRNFCEAMFFLEQCRNSKDFDKITKEIEKIKQQNLKQIKDNNDDELELFLIDLARWISALLKDLYNKNKILFPITTKNLEIIKDANMFAENFAKGFRKELKEAREKGMKKGIEKGIEKGIIEGKKSTFFEGLFLALSIKFDEITEKLKQKFLELKPKNLDLQNYKNIILSSNSAEEAYNKIAKLAAA